MSVDPLLQRAFRPFERRAMLVAFVKAMSIGLVASASVAEIALAFGVRNATASVALVVMAIVFGVIHAVAARPAPLALARRIDARARLNDLIVTAIDCGGDGLPAIVRRESLAALERESPAHAYPFEPPRHWRRFVVAAAAVQVVALAMLFRAPAGRAPEPGLGALVLPASSSTSASAGRDQQHPAQRPAAEQTASDTAPRAIVPASATTTRAGARAGADDSDAGARGASAASGDRLRLAAANAEAAIAAGRVPLARRAIVERYFAAIQSQGKRPR